MEQQEETERVILFGVIQTDRSVGMPRYPCVLPTDRRGAWKFLLPLLVLVSVVSCGDDKSGPLTPTIPPGFTYPVSAYREAGRVTAAGARAAVHGAQAGDSEGDLKTIIADTFRSEGSTSLAFDSIVATGANAMVLHYAGDDSTLRAGALTLIDIGAKSDGISSDCSRTFPVDTIFDARQRELYALVLDVQKRVAASAHPGVDSLVTLGHRARQYFRESPLRALDENGEPQTMDTFLIHGVTHYVGTQVHGEDTGWSPIEPIEVGQVFTIEPGLYIGTEGIGIRIEDTYLMTDTGLECLTCGCPKEPDEVEALRRSPARPSSVASLP
jgi:Xaa-Pro aminopeptidase